MPYHNFAGHCYLLITFVCAGYNTTIILVRDRVSMGLSFYDDSDGSTIESIVESLHFACKQSNLTTVTGDDGHNDDSIHKSDDIELVDR